MQLQQGTQPGFPSHLTYSPKTVSRTASQKQRSRTRAVGRGEEQLELSTALPLGLSYHRITDLLSTCTQGKPSHVWHSRAELVKS